MQRICVFCGSSSGASPEYQAAATRLGHLLAERRIALVYGGSNVGLMGALADAVLAAGGHAIGVIPRSLVDRDLADGFIAMPGGYGTFDELCEILTWAQLGIHARPVGLLNTLGYWNPFLQFLDHAVAAGFLKPAHRAFLEVCDTPPGLLDRLLRNQPQPVVSVRIR